jgi:ABC-type molybdate transport system, periplasmic component
MVELGEAPLGVVYRTDALKSKKVNTVGTFPANSHEPVDYIAGLFKGSQNGKKYFDFINSADTKAIWEKNGFSK